MGQRVVLHVSIPRGFFVNPADFSVVNTPAFRFSSQSSEDIFYSSHTNVMVVSENGGNRRVVFLLSICLVLVFSVRVFKNTTRTGDSPSGESPVRVVSLNIDSPTSLEDAAFLDDDSPISLDAAFVDASGEVALEGGLKNFAEHELVFPVPEKGLTVYAEEMDGPRTGSVSVLQKKRRKRRRERFFDAGVVLEGLKGDCLWVKGMDFLDKVLSDISKERFVR